jgi:hypothetical protein
MCLLMSLWNLDFIWKIKTKSIGIQYPVYPVSLKMIIFTEIEILKDQLPSELLIIYTN